MTAALFACMRNEGPFLLEWVAYHSAIGFAPVIVATNDCTDGSDTLMDALQAAGLAIHLRNTVPPGTAPQDAGMQMALQHLSKDGPEWLCHLDSDEFLNIRSGTLVDLTGTDAHAIAIAWRAFGDSGTAQYPGETLPAFTACEATPDPDRVKFKSLFRHRLFAHAREHMPTRPRIPHPVAVNARHEPLDPDNLTGEPRSRYHPIDRATAWEAAQINHYTRSQDVFLMKNDRGDGQGKADLKYRLGGRWHRQANRNEVPDRSILRHWPATRTLVQEWRAIPAIAAAEATCIDAFATRRDSVLTPERIRDWTRGKP
ncbi:MAG: glycosyltransferase family 2 protein [Gemmobacter sp.]